MKFHYDKIYSFFCGTHPHLRILHFQWLAAYHIYADLRRELSLLRGKVLDVGCGSMPYEGWISGASEVVGLDEIPGPKVTHLVSPETKWPFADNEFDSVLCTQVLEHLRSPEFLIKEVYRCVKPEGRVIFSAPFIYSEHGSPQDFYRFSGEGLSQSLSRAGFEILKIEKQGGIGSTLGLLLLGWLQVIFDISSIRIPLFRMLLPVWILFTLTINIIGRILDFIDPTENFYSNVLAVARKGSKCSV